MPNEVTIVVRMQDATAATKAEIQAGIEGWAAGIGPVRVKASNPIDEAWQATVRDSVQETVADPVEVVFEADTADLEASVEETFAAIRAAAAEPLAIGPADVEVFQASALEAIASVRAQIAAVMTPIEMPTVYATATRLDQSEEAQMRALSAGVEPGEMGYGGTGMAPGSSSFRPGYTPGPMFGPEGDPYAAARQQIAEQAPVELPVRAANPIDDAWVSMVRSEVRGVAVDALQIPAVPELEGFQAQLEDVLTDLSTTSRLDVPVDVGDAMIFREQVAEMVAQVEQSVKAVIDVQVDDTGLSDLQAKTIGASQAELDLVAAQQKLNEAMASGDEDKITKARTDVVSATNEATEATKELEAAQVAAAAAETAGAEAADAAAVSARGLNEAMGPLWMVMNVVQMAAFGMGGMFGSSASQAQSLATQLVSLGQATGSSASSTLDNNQALSTMNDQLTKIGSSSAAYAQAAEGVQSFTQYSNQLQSQQTSLGNTMVTVTEQVQQNTRAGQDQVSATKSVTESIADLAQAQGAGGTTGMQLSQSVQGQIDKYNAYVAVMPTVRQELQLLQAQQALENAQLQAAGFSMSASAQATNAQGLALEQLVKDYDDATAGAKYMEDSQDKATITAGQAAQQWQQLQQAVSQAGDAYTQSKDAVANAEHGVETATQGVDSAIHAQQQSVIAAAQSQQAYTAAVYQETQAQQAVTAARAAAEQQLVSLNLQANDAAESVNAANLSLYNAQTNASKYGVNTGNAQQIADTQNITSANVNQVTAAQQLVAAENALADAQNSSSQAQSTLNTARQQGVDNNPNVLAAEHSLTQSQQAVATAAQGVTNAQYAEQQAAIQVSNAEYSLKQAHDAVAQAEQSELAAEVALTTARDNASRSTDVNTLAGAQNRQAIEGIYEAYVNAYGPTQTAIDQTETAGEKMGFTGTQIHDVIDRLNGLNGTSANFNITGTPSLNMSSLSWVGQQIGVAFDAAGALVANLADAAKGRAAGGPADSLTWVGEDGPELVDLPVGSSVHPHANSMLMAANGDAPALRRAAGGPVGSLANPMSALAVNAGLAGQWGMLDVVDQSLYALGGGTSPQLPPPPSHVDLGSFAGLGGVPGVPSSRSANEAAVQAVWRQYGWDQGAEWIDTVNLLMKESGFNNLAQNPTSTAFGAFQFLDSTWAGYGVPKTSDITEQAIAGGRYIHDRYGDPIGAWAHEVAHNWYAAGGGAGGLIGVGEDGPELLHVPGGSTVVPHANVAGTLGAQSVQVELTVNIVDAGNSAMGSWFKQQIKTGGIQLSANGARVMVNA